MIKVLRIALAASIAFGAGLTVAPGQGGSGELRLTGSAAALNQELTQCQQTCQAQYQADLAYCATFPEGGSSYAAMMRRLCFQSADAQLANCYNKCGGA